MLYSLRSHAFYVASAESSEDTNRGTLYHFNPENLRTTDITHTVLKKFGMAKDPNEVSSISLTYCIMVCLKVVQLAERF
jgi:hypothetical protein